MYSQSSRYHYKNPIVFFLIVIIIKFFHYFQKTNPHPEPSLNDSDISKAIELWSNLIHTSSVKFINVDMHSSTSFVYCKATFHQIDNDAIGVEVWLRLIFYICSFFISCKIFQFSKNMFPIIGK